MIFNNKFWRKAHVAGLLAFVVGNTLAFGKNIPKPIFENDPVNFTNAGYLKLGWHWVTQDSMETAPIFHLQRADNPNFENAATIYKGQDYASFRSGLENGRYYYRLNAMLPNGESSGWSEAIVVEVKHHSLALTLTLVSLGAIVFLLTVLIVVQGSRQVKTQTAY